MPAAGRFLGAALVKQAGPVPKPSPSNVTTQETIATQPQNSSNPQKSHSLLPARVPLLAAALALPGARHRPPCWCTVTALSARITLCRASAAAAVVPQLCAAPCTHAATNVASPFHQGHSSRSKIFQAWSRASGEFCFATEQNQLSVVVPGPHVRTARGSGLSQPHCLHCVVALHCWAVPQCSA